MSRIGKKPIALPKGVTCQIGNGMVEVKGPKGTLKALVPDGIVVKSEGAGLSVERRLEDKHHKACHGMVRSILANSVTGVTEGWKKELEIVGIGFKAIAEKGSLALSLGYSHVINFPIPAGIDIAVDKQTRLTISGADRQLVGQVAAEIRSLRPPEPYKGKGIKYVNEVIKKKVGKTGA